MADQPPQLDALFLAALEIPSPEERAAFLDQACGADRELRAQLESMLTSHAEAGSFLERPAPEIQATMIVGGIERERIQSLQAGLAAAFTEDQAVVLGDGNHSVLKSLGETVGNLPRVVLRESSDSSEEPIVKPKSAEMPGNHSDSRYQLQGEIARGGMGVILKGRDTDLGRDLAIKVLLDQHKDKPEVIQRFVEEAQIGGQLQHPGVAPVYELGQFNDKRPFFSMKLVKGQTLSKLLAEREGPVDDRGRFLGIFEQVCQTMAYAHSRGVIHRDLKPANIMVGAFGEVQVMDWGLAKVLPTGGVADEKKAQDRQQGQSIIQTLRSQVGSDIPASFGTVGSQTQMGSVMGTPAYMPPEQALGEIDHLDERADVFGLGAILCEILTGKPPYVAEDGTQVFRMASRGKLTDCFARLDACEADPDLIALTRKCLELDPDDRPRDAGELARRISEYLESVETKLREAELAKVDAQARAEELGRRRKLLYAIATLLLIGFVAAGLAASHFRSLEQSQRLLANEKSALAGRNEQLAKEREVERNAAIAARIDADRERDAAREAQLDALDQTYRARLNEIRAMRLARQSGWRSVALDRLGELTRLGSRNVDRVELRTEALACLAEMDVRLQPQLFTSRSTGWKIQYSPDGLAIAVSGRGETGATVVLHDVTTDLELLSIPRANLFSPFAFHPQGTLAVATGAGLVTWHPVKPGQPTFPEITGAGDVLNLAFSASGERLAVAWGAVHSMNPFFANELRQVTVHDTSTGQVLWTVNPPVGSPGGYKIPLGLSPDGESLAIAGPNVQALLYTVGADESPTVLGQLDTRICAFAFRPDGAALAVAGRLTGAVWNLESRTERFRMHAPEGGFWDIAYSPDGQLLAGCLNTATARLWNSATGRELAVIPLDSRYPSLSLSFSPQGDRFAVNGGPPRILLIEGRREFRANTYATNGLDGLAFDPTRQRLLALATDQLLSWPLDHPTARVVEFNRRGEDPNVMRLSPDGGQLAIGFGRWSDPKDYEFSIGVWTLDGQMIERRLQGPREPVLDVAFAPSGKRLAGVSEDGGIYLWDFETGTLESRVAHSGVKLRFLDEQTLIVAAENRLVLLTAGDGMPIRETRFDAALVSFNLSSDRSHVLAATDDGTVHRVRLENLTIEKSRRILDRPSDLLTSLSADGALLVVATKADPRIGLVDAHTLELLGQFPIKDVDMRFMEFDDVGRYFAMAGQEVTLWDLALIRGELMRIGLDFHDLSTDKAVDLFADLLQRSTRRAEKARILAMAAPLPGVIEQLSELATEDARFQAELARYLTEQGEHQRAEAARKKALAILESRLRQDPENAAAMDDLAELLLSDAFNDPGSVLKRVPSAAVRVGDLYLAAQDWEQAIAAYSGAITRETTDVDLLLKRAQAYLGVQQWEAAEADWVRIVELDPKRLRQAFDVFRRAERWSEAGRFGRQFAKQAPALRSDEWMPIPTVLVLAGDREGYLEVCERMREAFAASESAMDAERRVKVSLLWPDAIAPAALPAEKFTRGLDDGTTPPSLQSWFWAARALYALRSKDAESACKYVARCEECTPSVAAHAFNMAVLALAQQELDHLDEAHLAFDEARHSIDRMGMTPESRGYHDLLIPEILLREAAVKLNR